MLDRKTSELGRVFISYISLPADVLCNHFKIGHGGVQAVLDLKQVRKIGWAFLQVLDHILYEIIHTVSEEKKNNKQTENFPQLSSCPSPPTHSPIHPSIHPPTQYVCLSVSGSLFVSPLALSYLAIQWPSMLNKPAWWLGQWKQSTRIQCAEIKHTFLGHARLLHALQNGWYMARFTQLNNTQVPHSSALSSASMLWASAAS